MINKHHPLLHLVAARLREFCRQPSAIFWVYGFPLIMVVALGLAFRDHPDEEVAVAIQAGPQAKKVAAALQGNERISAKIASRQAAIQHLHKGEVDLLVVAASGTTPTFHYHYDPTKPASRLAHRVADDALQRAEGRQDVVPTQSHHLTEPGGRYIDFLVPGLLGMGLMGGGLWGIGFAIVDLRIRKLLKRYLATPMKRSQFLAAVMISRLLFMIPEIVLLLLFARLFFGVVIHGSYLAVGLLILLGAFQFAGIGLLIASRADTLETVSGIINLAMLPMWIASGIFFSPERFPEILQPLIQLLPLTPLIDALRQVMLDGAGLIQLAGHLAIIVGWGAITFFLALRWFRWT